MVAMIVYLFPRAKQAAQNSPKGTLNDWMGFLFPLGFVVLFILVLIMLM